MPRIGIVYGMESSFPSAVVDRINGKRTAGVTAEHIRIGGIRMAEPSGYAVTARRSGTCSPNESRVGSISCIEKPSRTASRVFRPSPVM